MDQSVLFASKRPSAQQHVYGLGGRGMCYDAELAGSASLTQETLFTENWSRLIRNCLAKHIVLLDSPGSPA